MKFWSFEQWLQIGSRSDLVTWLRWEAKRRNVPMGEVIDEIVRPHMMKQEWNPVLHIPEGQINDYKIEHVHQPAGYEASTSSARCTMIGGQPAGVTLKFDHPTVWHKLSYGGGVWMTDLPIEQAQHDRELADMKGDVLVGGLGLGYAVTQLCLRPEIENVVVIEKSKEVIDLVMPHLRIPQGKVTLVHADLLDWIETTHANQADETPCFDYAFYDIWQGDGMSTFFDVVCKLRQMSEGIAPDAQVVCWNEDVMRGQLIHNLSTAVAFATGSLIVGSDKRTPDEILDSYAKPKPVGDLGAQYHDWMVPFFAAIKDGMIDADKAMHHVRSYCAIYGRPRWEEWWQAGAEFVAEQ